MHGEKGYCKVCLKYDYVAETVAVDLGGVHLGLRWAPCPSALEIEARMRAPEQTPPALAPQPASSETPAGGQPPTVSAEEAVVLRVMLVRHPVQVTAEVLADLLRLNEKSIRSYLQSLQNRGLVTEPIGKKGRALTAAGLAFARSLPEGVGADLLRKKAPGC
jgi:hypothetical protein